MLFILLNILDSEPQLKYIETTTDKSQDGYGVSFVLTFEMVSVVVLVALVVSSSKQTLSYVICSSFPQQLIGHLVHLSSMFPLLLSKLAMDGLYPLNVPGEFPSSAFVSAVNDW